MSRFGALIRTYRLKAGLTQQELATRAGLSVAALRDFEQSRRHRPRQSSMSALVSALGLDSVQAADLASAARLAPPGGEAGPVRPGGETITTTNTQASRASHASSHVSFARAQASFANAEASFAPLPRGPLRPGQGPRENQGLQGPQRPQGPRGQGPHGLQELRGFQSPQGPQRPQATQGPQETQGLWLSVLGPLDAWWDGTPLSLGPPARRAVLGLLLLNPGVLTRRDTIVDALWGENPPRTAVDLVQAHVSRLRRALSRWESVTGGVGAIDSVGGAYAVRLSSGELDLLRFRELAAAAVRARADGDWTGACEEYERAIGMWRGDPLADVDLLRGHSSIALLRQELTGALLRYAEVACALGHYRKVLPRLQALAAAEPLNESVHARLMIVLAGSGKQAAAIRMYEDLRLRLDRELGLYPGDELAEAHLRVLRQDIRPGIPERVNAPPAPKLAAVMVPRQLPAAPRHFTGRARELASLDALLERDAAERSVVIAALTGMAGIGKTALAVHWAHRIADRFPDGQLFANLRGSGSSSSPLSCIEAVRGFLIALGVPAARIPADDAGQAALYRSLLADRRMLIVLDNAQDAEQVRPLLPGSPGCLVLVTSRNRLTGLAAAEGAHLFTLNVLTEAESRDLLARKLDAGRVTAEPAAVGELSALCARLPLALSNVAARAAARPRLPLAALANEMRNERWRLDALETGESATSVRAVFSWSRARLSESAARMFGLLGVHAGPDITTPAAASLAGLPRAEAASTLAELCDEHLLTEHAPGRYTCHDLLRAYAAERARTAQSEADQRAAVRRMLDHYLHTSSAAAAVLFPDCALLPCGQPLPGVLPEEITDRKQAAGWYENERHTLFAAILRAAQGGYAPHAWTLPWAAGLFFRDTACWWKLAAAQESALAVAIELGDPAGQALAHCHLGLLRYWLGKSASACHHLDEAVDVARKHGDKPLYALVGLNRARVLGAQERSFEALMQAGQSLALYREAGDRQGESRALDIIRANLEQLGEPGQTAATGRRELTEDYEHPLAVYCL